MANYETVIYEKVEDKIFRLTLNRPEKLNALSQKLLAELDQVMDEYSTDPEASVLIIRGAGRAFSAGYDLQGTQHPGSTFTVTNDRLGLHRTIERWQRLWSLPKPTIAQVHGFCLAAAPNSSATATSCLRVRTRSLDIPRDAHLESCQLFRCGRCSWVRAKPRNISLPATT